MQKCHITAVGFLSMFVFLASALSAQQSRITGSIDNSRRVVLYGHINPRAQAGIDQGRVLLFRFRMSPWC
jgi:hypothetical protein